MLSALQAAKNYLFRRQLAYLQVFKGQQGLAVLKDLSKFCRADRSTFDPDPRIHALLEGRKEVFLRITHQLNLNQEQLWEIYGRKDLE